MLKIYLLITIIILLFTMEYNNEKLNKFLDCGNSNNIAIYMGSFDPFHQGHKEVINTVLDNYCDKLICGVFRQNKYKPNLSCHIHRYRLLKIATKNINNIFILDNTLVDTHINVVIDSIKKNLKNVNLIGIIGSDIYERFINEGKYPKIDVNSFLVVPRADFIISPVIINSKFKIIDKKFFANNKATNLSSTYLRNCFKNSIKINNDDLILDCQQYIKNNLLYSDPLSVIYPILLNKFTDLNKKEIIDLTRPYSGNFVYSINKLNLIIKVFVESNIINGKSQLKTIDWFKDNDLFDINIYDTFTIDNLYFIIMEKVKGNNFKLLCLNNNMTFEISKLIGIQLRKLHDFEYIKPNDHIVQYWIKKLKPNIMYLDFVKDPGLFSYKVHGDFNLNNIIVDNCNIVFIDPESGEYPGPPALDYYRFLSCIKKLENNNIMEEGFKLGYGKINFSVSCQQFFESY